jgi:hypothetical protein
VHFHSQPNQFGPLVCVCVSVPNRPPDRQHLSIVLNSTALSGQVPNANLDLSVLGFLNRPSDPLVINQHPSIVSRSRRAVANVVLAEEATMHECE